MKTLAIALGRAGFAVRRGARRFRLVLDNGEPCRGCARIVLRDGSSETIVWQDGAVVGERLEVTGRTPSGTWTLCVSGETRAGGVDGIRLELSGKARRSKRIAALEPLVLERMPAEHVQLHGRSSGGCRGVRLPSDIRDPLTSHLFVMVTQGGRTLQLAQPLRQRHPAAFHLRLSGTTVARLAVHAPVEPAQGGRLTSEPVSLHRSADGHGLLEAWAAAQVPATHRPSHVSRIGWNSWDYYRWTVTEEAVLRNAEFIAADPVLGRHVKRLIIDDGWQYAYGEWEANPLFPNGMHRMAKRLSRMGFEPGIWMAPAVVEPHARIAQMDGDMLAKGRSGMPCLAFTCMGRQCFLLDPTVAKSRQWVHALIARHADMGFRYFKIDFLKALDNAPCFADATVPRGMLVRKLLEPIRDALHQRGTLMGCNHDFHAGMDLVDEVRTSSDIHARWSSIRQNAGSIAARWWAQGQWWINDPDFALARGPETSDDPDLQRMRPCHVFVTPEATSVPHGGMVLATMSLQEARTLLGLVLMSGGAINLSDDLTKLNEDGLALLRRVVSAPRGAAGVPLDLFAAELPSRWVQRLGDGWRVLLVNWTDAPRDCSLDLRAAGISVARGRDFWTQARIEARGGVLTQPLEPHACLLAEFTASTASSA